MKYVLLIGGWLLGISLSAQAKLIDAPGFMKLAGDSNMQKLDVRTHVEFEMVGHITGFANINVESPHFEDSLLYRFDKDRPILVTCFSGHRSSKAVLLMLDLGYKTIFELKGGIIAWMNAGYPLE